VVRCIYKGGQKSPALPLILLTTHVVLELCVLPFFGCETFWCGVRVSSFLIGAVYLYTYTCASVGPTLELHWRIAFQHLCQWTH
jgi:hypothetical protein